MSLNPNALVTLSMAKSHLDIKQDYVLEDTRLEFFVNAASERVASYCNRIFQQATYTELHSGRRQNELLPRQFPITAITSVVISQSRNWTEPQSLVDSTRYVIADEDNTIQYDGIFPTGYNNIQVVYTAGYTTFPSDLQLACLWFVEWFYRHRTRGHMGISNISKMEENTTILTAMPPMIVEILNDYKRCEFANTQSPVRNS